MKEFIPHKYQIEPINKLKEKEHYGLFAFPGSGKTVMSLEAIYAHRKCTLIVVPLSILYSTWLHEHLEWSFSQNLKVNVLHGKDKNKNFFNEAGVHLINPEGMDWLVKKVAQTKHFPWKILIVDESVKFKNYKSNRFKALKRMLTTFEHRYILCGNPIPNHYLDLWAQLFILDCGKRLDTSFYQFRNKYFYPTDYRQYNWELKPNAKEEIIEKISDIVDFIEVGQSGLDLPERIEVDLRIELSDKIMKQYKQMEKDLFLALDEDEEVLASNRTSALMKCWQIANGFIYNYDEEGTRKTEYIHNEIIEIAKEKVEEMQGQPILLVYHFNEDLERLRKEFPKATYVSDKAQVGAIEQSWNNNEITILIAQLDALSHGINLQYGSGKTIFFYSLTYNYDTYDQLIRRIQRQGSENDSVIIFRAIVKDTVHEAIIKTIDSKETMSSEFLSHLLEYKNAKDN